MSTFTESHTHIFYNEIIVYYKRKRYAPLFFPTIPVNLKGKATSAQLSGSTSSNQACINVYDLESRMILLYW